MKEQPITIGSIVKVWPLFVAIVGASVLWATTLYSIKVDQATSFAQIDKRQALIEQKLDQILTLQGQINSMKSEIGTLSLNINTIKTILKIP